MGAKQPKLKATAFAWGTGWALMSLGLVLSDAYSFPNRGLATAYLLGIAGWALGAGATIRSLRQRFGAENSLITLSAAGWGIGAVMAVILGLFWLQTWELGFLGPIAGISLGAAIGGGLTLPYSPRPKWRVGLCGTLSWGISFLLFQVLAFFSGYILMQLTVNPLLPSLGHVWSKAPGWVLPAGVCGFLAAWIAGRLAGLDR